ncbi:sigma-70 family RNA polymerase sigma factor, partial [bacterium]
MEKGMNETLKIEEWREPAEHRMSESEERRFNELMEATGRKVYNMAFRLAGNRPDAEDLTQEAFFRAYRSFKDYEGDRPFENWIFRIVTRLYLDLLRNRRRRISAVSYDAPIHRDAGEDGVYFEVADDGPTPESSLMDNTLSEDLQVALGRLTDGQRELIQLADVQGVPYAEIAERLGTPVGTIRSRLHRTHKLLRSTLEKVRREETFGAPAAPSIRQRARNAAH